MVDLFPYTKQGTEGYEGKSEDERERLRGEGKSEGKERGAGVFASVKNGVVIPHNQARNRGYERQ